MSEIRLQFQKPRVGSAARSSEEAIPDRVPTIGGRYAVGSSARLAEEAKRAEAGDDLSHLDPRSAARRSTGFSLHAAGGRPVLASGSAGVSREGNPAAVPMHLAADFDKQNTPESVATQARTFPSSNTGQAEAKPANDVTARIRSAFRTLFPGMPPEK